MPAHLAIIRARPESLGSEVELGEHKGIGRPGTICDGAAEAASCALARAYFHVYGDVQHYNVDEALLIGGESVRAT